jgi:hypothetical protein
MFQVPTPLRNKIIDPSNQLATMNRNLVTCVGPTYIGFIETTRDALLLFQAVINGIVSGVPRRPHEREREILMKSGNIFVYEEGTSAIKRWTDGIPWSPSRIIGNFLIYRELDKPFAPGEKKRATKRVKLSQPPRERAKSEGHLSSPISRPSSRQSSSDSLRVLRPLPYMTPEIERMLVGSLVDSYGFKHDGLIKKTISVQYAGRTYHMVSYYTITHFMETHLDRPSQDRTLNNQVLHPELIGKQSFRQAIDARGLELTQPDSRYGPGPASAGGQVRAGPTSQNYAYQPAVVEYPGMGPRYQLGGFESNGQGDVFEYQEPPPNGDDTPPDMYTSQTGPATQDFGDPAPAMFGLDGLSSPPVTNGRIYFQNTSHSNQPNYAQAPIQDNRMPRALQPRNYTDPEDEQYGVSPPWTNGDGSYSPYQEDPNAPYNPNDTLDPAIDQGGYYPANQ